MSKTTTYRTNIKCDGCIATVTPHLNKTENIINWSVDLESPEKILTVEFANIKKGEVESLMKEAGYEASIIT